MCGGGVSLIGFEWDFYDKTFHVTILHFGEMVQFNNSSFTLIAYKKIKAHLTRTKLPMNISNLGQTTHF